MSLSAACKNVALICKIFDLPFFYKKRARVWSLQIDNCLIAMRYLSKSDELEISHQLSFCDQKTISFTDTEICDCFSKSYLKRKTHWIEWDVAKKAMFLFTRLSVRDGNECELAIQLPYFLQHCGSWKLFVKQSVNQKSECIFFSHRPQSLTLPIKRARALAICDDVENQFSIDN